MAPRGIDESFEVLQASPQKVDATEQESFQKLGITVVDDSIVVEQVVQPPIEGPTDPAEIVLGDEQFPEPNVEAEPIKPEDIKPIEATMQDSAITEELKAEENKTEPVTSQ